MGRCECLHVSVGEAQQPEVVEHFSLPAGLSCRWLGLPPAHLCPCH